MCHSLVIPNDIHVIDNVCKCKYSVLLLIFWSGAMQRYCHMVKVLTCFRKLHSNIFQLFLCDLIN